MKKIILFFTFILLASLSRAALGPLINSVSTPLGTSIPKYSKFELDIDISDQDNGNQNYLEPADPAQIKVWVEFTHVPTGKIVNVDAFFYQDYQRTFGNAATLPICVTPQPYQLGFWQYCQANATQQITNYGFQHPYEILTKTGTPKWKARFTPSDVGNWTYRVYAQDPDGTVSTLQANFTCLSSSAKGFIRKANKRYLKFDNGDPLFINGPGMGGASPVVYGDYVQGANGFSWYSFEEYGTVEYESYLNDYALKKINYIRIFLQPECINIFGYDYGMDVCFYKNIQWNDPTTASSSNENSYGINLRDAWQLDFIMNHCASKGINVQLAFFDRAIQNCGIGGPNPWDNNPFNASGTNALNSPPAPFVGLGTSGCNTPYEFFDMTKASVFKLQKDMIRYVMSRWGYATNLVSWEIYNEINLGGLTNTTPPCSSNPGNGTVRPANLERKMLDWVDAVKNYVKSIDPYKHLITCTPVSCNQPRVSDGLDWCGIDDAAGLWSETPRKRLTDEIAKIMDYTDEHRYTDPFIAIPGPGLGQNYCNPTTVTAPEQLYDFASAYESYMKPHNISEFTSLAPDADVNNGTCITPGMRTTDPKGFHFHSVEWSSGFSGNMGAGSCWWHWLVLMDDLDYNYNALHEYWKNVKFDQDDNVSYYKSIAPATGGVHHYYFVKNQKEIYGWVQDKNHAIEQLKTYEGNATPIYKDYLKNPIPANKPPLSVTWPHIIANNVKDGWYEITYYNTKTGAIWYTENVVASGNTLDLNKLNGVYYNSILQDPNNTFGDFAYKAVKRCGTADCGWNENPLNLLGPKGISTSGMKYDAVSNHIYYVDLQGNLCNMYMDNTWQGAILNTSFAKVYPSTSIESDAWGNVFYIGIDNKVYRAWWNNGWNEEIICGPWQAKPNTGLTLDGSGNVYFISISGPNDIFKCSNPGTGWTCNYLQQTLPTTKPGSDIEYAGGARQEIFYVAVSDGKLHSAYLSGSTWIDMVVSNTQVKQPSSPVGSRFVVESTGWSRRVFFIGTDNKIYNVINTNYPGTTWIEGPLNTNAPLCMGSSLVYAGGDHVYYVGPNNELHNLYWANNMWNYAPLNTCRVSLASYASEMAWGNNNLYYVGLDGNIRGAFWTYDICPPNRLGNIQNPVSEINPSEQEKQKLLNMSLYPNPAQEEVSIRLETIHNLDNPELTLTNIMGETFITKKLDPITEKYFDTKIDMKGFKPGIYFITLINNEQKVITKKIVLQ